MLHYKSSLGSRVFDIGNVCFLALFSSITLFPFLYVLATSLAPMEQVLRGGLILWPDKLTWDAYHTIFFNTHFVRSLWMSIFITVMSTFVGVLCI
jgi:putative aldouronate transport system permease protein